MDESDQITLSCRVDTYRSGWTLLRFLSHKFRYHPAERWSTRVREGRVQVNGARVGPEHVVNDGDAVSYTIHHTEPAVDFAYDVIYEDDVLLAVSKSGNIPVHASGIFIRNTLIQKLKADFGENVRLVHRLDRETSGLVLLAKTKAAARDLSLQFHDNRVEKTYVAVVHGHVEEDAFEVNAPIGNTGELIPLTPQRETMRGLPSDLRASMPKMIRRRSVDFAAGKPARTFFEVLRRVSLGTRNRGGEGGVAGERPSGVGVGDARSVGVGPGEHGGKGGARGGGFTVLNCRPITGRTNQIRVHLRHAGHPIVGDKIYGDLELDACFTGGNGQTGASGCLPVMGRQALHCAALVLSHPGSEESVVLRALLPDDMKPFAD